MHPQIEILKEDNDILVCRKPAGIPVQTAKMGQQDMISLLKNHRATEREIPEIYVVHRLDQPVEGVMVFAKNPRAAAALSRQIQGKTVDKYYRALVEGVPDPAEGRLEDYLLRDGKTNTSRVVSSKTDGAKKADLSYRVLEIREDRSVSLLEIRLETGRHHQIRVQMAHAGHPLVGDKKYNPGCTSEYLPIGLSSVRIAFCHPTTGRRLEYVIEPTGEAFRQFHESAVLAERE
jgi:23S rRNA pseudouridine1911/1915/1917 synthase